MSIVAWGYGPQKYFCENEFQKELEWMMIKVKLFLIDVYFCYMARNFHLNETINFDQVLWLWNIDQDMFKDEGITKNRKINF